MKIFRLLLIVVCLIPPFSGFAKRNIKVQEKENKNERSIEAITPIEAWLEDSSKEIVFQFYCNLGPVIITVTNHSGKTIYEEIADTDTMSSLHIYLYNLSKGEYMLSITTSNNILYGDFSIY